jgi:bifunctional non-homologous end joining protein LigD
MRSFGSLRGFADLRPNAYLIRMFDFCLPTAGTTVPDGHDWFHEIKYDGYRLRVERNGDRVRLITRGGYDWTKRS